MLDLSIVVLSWNTRELTLACLAALQRDESTLAREIIVIDNGSHDGSADAIAAAHPGVQLVRNAANRGYAGGNNQGAALAQGEYLCLLNSDTEVRPLALDRLVGFLRAAPAHGAVAPRLVHPDGSVQHACMRFPGLATALCFDTVFGRVWPGTAVVARYHMRDFDHLTSRDVAQPPGACFVIARAEYLAMGGFDEELWLYFNDVDLCRRLAQAGRRIHYLATAEVMHHVGGSTRSLQKIAVAWHRNRLAYYRKHYGPWCMPYLRAITRWRALEEWIRAGRRHAEKANVRAERAFLKQCLQEILAP